MLIVQHLNHIIKWGDTVHTHCDVVIPAQWTTSEGGDLNVCSILSKQSIILSEWVTSIATKRHWSQWRSKDCVSRIVDVLLNIGSVNATFIPLFARVAAVIRPKPIQLVPKTNWYTSSCSCDQCYSVSKHFLDITERGYDLGIKAKKKKTFVQIHFLFTFHLNVVIRKRKG